MAHGYINWSPLQKIKKRIEIEVFNSMSVFILFPLDSDCDICTHLFFMFFFKGKKCTERGQEIGMSGVHFCGSDQLSS